MAKGLFTQGVCLLTDGRTTYRDIRTTLKGQGFEIVRDVAAAAHWSFGGPTAIVPFRPEVNGIAAVDVVDHPWPDGMGDPKTEAMVFGAWAMGQFGPLAFPRGLERAREQSWVWEPGRTVGDKHQGFVRVRTSYVMGSGEDAPIWPKDYDPLGELDFVGRVVLALLRAPGVLCYFNPNGEVLRDAAAFQEVWEACRKEDKLPLPLWANVRSYQVDDRLAFMDTVGNGQMDLPDIEAVFPTAEYDPLRVDYYLRNVTHYLLDAGVQFQSGEAIDGPGEGGRSWTTEALDSGLADPPRRVLRLYPKASRQAVTKALARLGGRSK